MSERKKLIFSLLEKRNFIKIDLSNFKDDTKLILFANVLQLI